jgi:GNAT superfamily N-acetyltransferase
VLIREAGPQDWPGVAALLAQLGRPDVRETEQHDAAREVYHAYLDRSDAVALVAEDGGRIVGFLDMEFRTRLNFTSPQAWIPDLVVEEDTRGGGIGGALMERAEEVARDRGCWSMALESAAWRERAHAFYLAHGWQDAGKAFTKVLAEGITWPPVRR